MCKHISISIIAIIVLAIGISHLSFAKGPLRTNPNYHELDVANPYIMNRVHWRSNVWMNISNWGVIGNNGPSSSGLMEDPEFPGTWAPQCEFPGGSGVQYLYMGSLWFGAIIQEEGSLFPRVSVGRDGWAHVEELFPGEDAENGIIERSNIPGAINYLGEEIYSPDAVAPQEFISTYTDTLNETFWIQPDPVDGPHRPLGVRVRQKSMVWDAFGFDDFIMFDFTVENIGDDTLKNPYVGWYIDADVGWIEEMPDWHQDDLTGFLGICEDDTLNVGYINDNDGRPYNVPSGSNFTTPGVAGTYILQTPDNPAHFSFNWWISNANPAIDYGPCWEVYIDSAGYEWMQIYGTPMGDLRKYQVMSNRETDYDQVRVDEPVWISAHPQQFFNDQGQLIEEQPWLPSNAANPTDLANGFDTRYLMSWGPLGENIAPPGEEPETYLYPGDSLRLTLAYVCADSFHDRQHPQPDPECINPDLYVYEDLAYNCKKAQFLFDHDFQVLPPYAPENFRITESTDDYIQLEWDSYPTMPGTLIDIYRKIEGGEYGENPINTAPLSGTTYDDYDIVLGTHYTYKAQAIRYDTLKSYYSEEASQLAGAPIIPTGLVATSSQNGSVPLSWDSNTEPDLYGYNIYRADSAGVYQPIGTSTVAEYTDQNVTNGIQYSYKVSAEDLDHYESELSDSAAAIPMGFYDDLLVVLYHSGGSILEWQDVSLDNYYQTLFEDIGESPDFIYLNESTPYPTLVDVSPYRSCWIIDDTRQNRSGSSELRQFRDELLPNYIDLGGNVIVSGRKMIVGWFGLNMGLCPYPEYPLDEYFGVIQTRGATWPPINPVGFITAQSSVPTYPNLNLDSAKVELLIGQPIEYTMEIDGLEAATWGETFYTYIANYPDSSEFHRMATGVRWDSTTALITFPLYAMEPYDSVLILAENILGYIRGGHFSGVNDGIAEPVIPKDYALYQNYPNPFNASTIVPFALPAASKINLTVYNIMGRKVLTVADGWYDAGTHRVLFDASRIASGIYFYQLKAGEFINVRKMVLLK